MEKLLHTTSAQTQGIPLQKNNPIHDGLLLSQSSKNASPLTHDDDAVKRHVSRVIHLLAEKRPSSIDFLDRHG